MVDQRGGNSVGGMDNGGSVDGVGNGVSNSVGNRDSLRVDSLAVVGDSSDVSLDVVGSVFNVLGAAVREGDGVRSSPGSGAVISLGSLEVGAGVVVGNGVLVLVGGDLVGVHLGNGVGNGVGNHRGVVSGGSVDDRGSVNSVDQRGVVGNSVVGNGVGNGVASVDKGSGVDNGVSQMGGNSVADNGSVSNMGDMGDLGGGGGSKAEEGRDRKGLN